MRTRHISIADKGAPLSLETGDGLSEMQTMAGYSMALSELAKAQTAARDRRAHIQALQHVAQHGLEPDRRIAQQELELLGEATPLRASKPFPGALRLMWRLRKVLRDKGWVDAGRGWPLPSEGNIK